MSDEEERRLPAWRIVAETFVITIAMPAIGWVFDRDDPFFLRRGFAWLAIAPLLVGVRYGSTPGLACAAALDTALLISWRTHRFGVTTFPADLIIGLIMLAILTGQLTDVQQRAIRQLRTSVAAAQRRLEELGRAYFLLELSHDRLNERQGRGAPSLRQALIALHAAAEKSRNLEVLAPSLVEILATYCMIEMAALHAVRDRLVAPKALATVGKAGDVETDDPIIEYALRKRRLVHIPAAQEATGDEHSPLLAAAPLVDVRGKVHAIVCVQAMPFVAFEKRNLDAIATIANHAADLLAEQVGNRRGDFEARLARAVNDLRLRETPSTLARLVVGDGTLAAGALDVLLGGTLRSSDAAFQTRAKDGKLLILALFPALGRPQAEQVVLERLESLAKSEFGVPLAQAGAAVELVPFEAKDDPYALVAKLVDA